MERDINFKPKGGYQGRLVGCSGLFDIFCDHPMTWGKGSKLGYKWCSSSFIVQPNPIKLGTIIAIYSVIKRAKNNEDSSNRLGDMAI